MGLAASITINALPLCTVLVVFVVIAAPLKLFVTVFSVHEIVTVTVFILGIVYAVLAQEPVGVAGLFLTGGLTLIIGTYFRFVSRRLEERPEDNRRRNRRAIIRRRGVAEVADVSIPTPQDGLTIPRQVAVEDAAGNGVVEGVGEGVLPPGARALFPEEMCGRGCRE